MSIALSMPSPYRVHSAVSSNDVREIGRIVEKRTPTGEVRYYLKFGRAGRIYSDRNALGHAKPLRTREDAEWLLNDIRSTLRRTEMSLDAVLDQFRPSPVLSVGRRTEAWLEALDRRAQAGEMTSRSAGQYRADVARYWGPVLELQVASIRAGHLQDWATWLLAQGGRDGAPLSVESVLTTLARFRAFLQWLRDRDEIAVTAIPRFPKLQRVEREPELLTREEQDRVLAAIPWERRGLFLAMADLAVRPGEARAMLRSDIADGWVTVQRASKGGRVDSPVGTTKTRRVRKLPVSPRLTEWLAGGSSGERNHAGPTPKVATGETTPAPTTLVTLAFPAPGGRMWAHDHASGVWGRACREAGVRDVPMREGTRHSTATWLREQDASVYDIQQLLGHVSPTHTSRYARPRARNLERLADRMKGNE